MELIEVDTSLYEELEKYEGGLVIFNFIPLYIIAWNLLFGLWELPWTSDGYYFLGYLEMWKSILKIDIFWQIL